MQHVLSTSVSVAVLWVTCLFLSFLVHQVPMACWMVTDCTVVPACTVVLLRLLQLAALSLPLLQPMTSMYVAADRVC